jgi:hypothetical protein
MEERDPALAVRFDDGRHGRNISRKID